MQRLGISPRKSFSQNFLCQPSLARRIAERGHHFSIPANSRRSESFTRMPETLPREQLLLETDGPYLGPEPGVASEPAHVAGTAAYAAELWGASVGEVRLQVEAGYQNEFGCYVRSPVAEYQLFFAPGINPTGTVHNIYAADGRTYISESAAGIHAHPAADRARYPDQGLQTA